MNPTRTGTGRSAVGRTFLKARHPRTSGSTTILLLVFALLTFFTTMASAQDTPTPTAPAGTTGLTHLYSLNCTLGTPIVVGAIPVGTRVAIPITGGSFSGPRLSGQFCLHFTSCPSHRSTA
jgi:hypothetical protein